MEFIHDQMDFPFDPTYITQAHKSVRYTKGGWNYIDALWIWLFRS